MQLQWVATEMLTGDVICDLNGLDCSEVAQTIGRYETATMSLPIPSAPPEWQRATTEGGTGLWLLTDNVPQWGGYIATATDSESDTIALSTPTWENYLDQRLTGTRTYTNVGQNDIVADLITNCVAAGPDGGLPIRVQYTTPGVGQLRTITYNDQDDKTVYSALQDAMNWEGGPEWYIGGEWNGTGRITLVLYVGDRVGTAVEPGLEANAQFDMPGNVSKFSRVRSFGQGKGANAILAYASGQGTTRLQSPVQSAPDPLRPTFEYRWTPSSSITDVNTLTAYATAALANMKGGTRSLSLEADADDTRTPKIGTDWNLGDDIGYDIGGKDTKGRETVPAFPGGIKGTARAIGYKLTLGPTRTVTPVLVGSDI
ncbi:hypothetical protein HII28_02210 [Planctomonas sp. JC2975]|uniref:hypothetical protein n=1 Tax=Planctomonas sp. JC2975 TaxID=2729626 RepID=UPI001474AA24|nr:hypothetical protein [Planctomonas sp. JC2975]NNC10701.1 hypothetical protein [Planctomonas sp. JC2975]